MYFRLLRLYISSAKINQVEKNNKGLVRCRDAERPERSVGRLHTVKTKPVYFILIFMNYIIMNGSDPVEISEPLASVFLQLTEKNEAAAFANDLMLVFELALFHSRVPIDEPEKAALFNLKSFADKLT